MDEDRYNGPKIFQTLLDLEPKLGLPERRVRVASWINRNLASVPDAEILATMMQTPEGQKTLIDAWWAYEAMPDSI